MIDLVGESVERVLPTIELEGVYEDTREAHEVREVLAFWEVIKLMPDDFSKASEFEERRDIIYKASEKHFCANILVWTVANLECLPTPMFRRALWYFNIDFLSPESFLRRITEQQRLDLNYVRGAISGPQIHVPACCTVGYKNRIRSWLFGNWTVENMYDENHTERRYEEKGAIAREFFWLDWGYNLYEDSKEDAQNKLAFYRRMFTKKTNENPFSVNDDDGLFFWLFATLVSNWAWNYQKEVRFDGHVCLRAQYTIATWIFVILGSPLLLALGLMSDSWISYPALALSMITPSIIALGCIRQFFREIGKLLGNNYFEYGYGERMNKAFPDAVFYTIITVVSIGIGSLACLWWYESIIIAFAHTAFVFWYGMTMYVEEERLSPFDTDYGLHLLSIPLLIISVGRLLYDFGHSLLELLLALVIFALTYWIELVAMAVPLVLGLLYLFRATNNKVKWKSNSEYISHKKKAKIALRESRQAHLMYRLEQGVSWTFLVTFGAALIVIIEEMPLLHALIAGIMIGTVLITCQIILWLYEKRDQLEVRLALRRMQLLQGRSAGNTSKDDLIVFGLCSNRWFLQSEPSLEAHKTKLRTLANAINELARDPATFLYFPQKINERGAAKVLETIADVEFKIWDYDADFLKVVLLYQEGMSMEAAKQKVLDEMTAWNEKTQAMHDEKLAREKWIASLLVVRAWHKFWNFFPKVWGDFWDLYRDFQERCPIIPERKSII